MNRNKQILTLIISATLAQYSEEVESRGRDQPGHFHRRQRTDRTGFRWSLHLVGELLRQHHNETLTPSPKPNIVDSAEKFTFRIRSFL